MGPWRLKWAQKRPKQPKMGPNAPKMTPNLGKRFLYVRPPDHHVFGLPPPGWRRSAATLRLKMAKNGPLEAKWTQKGPKQPKMPPNAPKMNPNPGARFHYARPPYHHALAVWFTSFGRGQEWTVVFSNNSSKKKQQQEQQRQHATSNKQVGFN